MLQMSRRTARPGGTGKAELVALVLVLVAGVATAWWAGGRVDSRVDISGLSSVARVLGIFNVGQLRGHAAAAAAPATAVQQPALGSPTAAYCQPGQQPAFAPSVANLQQRLGETMGAPLECEHPGSPNGDTVQQTTTGLVIDRAASNTVIFTDGWRHWALRAEGMVAWEGQESDPPTDSKASPAAQRGR